MVQQACEHYRGHSGRRITGATLDGNVKYNMPAGTQPGAVFKLKGKGIQRLNSVGKGDEYVQIIVDIPTGLTHEQKELLRTFDKATRPPRTRLKKAFLTSSRRNKYKEKSALQGLQCAFLHFTDRPHPAPALRECPHNKFPEARRCSCRPHLPATSPADIGGQVNDFLALFLPFFLFVLLRHKKSPLCNRCRGTGNSLHRGAVFTHSLATSTAAIFSIKSFGEITVPISKNSSIFILKLFTYTGTCLYSISICNRAASAFTTAGS